MNKEIVFEGKKIFYRLYGSGKPVMLVHGFGETGEVWKNQISFFESKTQLIIPDLPGSGSSEMTDDMSMSGMAEIIKIIVNEEAINRFVLIGHSMGGYIALALAEKYPEMVEKLCLFHSIAFADSEEKKATRKKGIAFIKEHGAFEFLKNTTPNLFSPVSKSKTPLLVDSFIESLMNFSDQSLISYYEAMMKRPDRTSVLKNAEFPVQFILGKDDVAVPLEDGLKQSYFSKQSHIDILKESGHMGMLEEPEICNDILQQFLL
jgi:pimeloyl-ACP methyl ester carboxylesterase